eukprot:TRINITY_DN15104_c0_g1_i5.p1 TRINITY_DN15104_c0_g1~~TRINITY_DN15104_c0_g1_i5.p1  ORF type:complete len:455 (+),score=107.89 TRINITY_DN15104_c0_g1_i5:580-1944(+)
MRQLCEAGQLRSLACRHVGSELAEEVNVEAAADFIAALCSVPSLPDLQHLDVNHCGIGAGGDGAAFADAVRRCAELRSIRASWNGFGPTAAHLIGDLQHLQSLHIGLNSVGPAGAAALAERMQSCPRLTELDVNDNGVGARGAAALCAAVSSHPSITSLGLHGNAIGDEGANAAAAAVKQSQTLRRLDVSSNGITHAAVPALCSAATSLTGLSVAGNDLSAAAHVPLLGLARNPGRLRDLDLFQAVEPVVRAAVLGLLRRDGDDAAALSPGNGPFHDGCVVWLSGVHYALAAARPDDREAIRAAKTPAAATSQFPAEGGGCAVAAARATQLKFQQDPACRAVLRAVSQEAVSSAASTAAEQWGSVWECLRAELPRLQATTDTEAAADAEQPHEVVVRWRRDLRKLPSGVVRLRGVGAAGAEAVAFASCRCKVLGVSTATRGGRCELQATVQVGS